MKPVCTMAFAALLTLGVHQSQAAVAVEPMHLAQASASGVVEKIEVVKKDQASNNTAGTVIGGVVGGLLGHQIGGGRGKTAATAAGAVGGALAGREIQKRRRNQDETFRVTVRMDDGTRRAIVQDQLSDLKTGQRVRIEGDRLMPE